MLLEEVGSDPALETLLGRWQAVFPRDTLELDVRRHAAGRAKITITGSFADSGEGGDPHRQLQQFPLRGAQPSQSGNSADTGASKPDNTSSPSS